MGCARLPGSTLFIASFDGICDQLPARGVAGLHLFVRRGVRYEIFSDQGYLPKLPNIPPEVETMVDFGANIGVFSIY
jgi:hypothetical protein